MARKLARLERVGALTPRDRMWASIRALSNPSGNSFSPIEIMHMAGVENLDTAMTYIRALTLAEPPYAELVDNQRPAGRPKREYFQFRLVRDVGVEAPCLNAEGKPTEPAKGATQMWLAMRAYGRDFDPRELANDASTPDCAISAGTAKNYLAALARAGYLVVSQPAGRGVAAPMTRYRFVRARNTGPRAPLVLRNQDVMDANNGEIVWEKNKAAEGQR